VIAVAVDGRTSPRRTVLIEDAYSFTPEDQPDRLAEEIVKFAEA
jgi:hypothetical protein